MTRNLRILGLAAVLGLAPSCNVGGLLESTRKETPKEAPQELTPLPGTGSSAPATAPDAAATDAPELVPVSSTSDASSARSEPGYFGQVEGDVYLKGTADAEWAVAEANVPVYAGDAIWTDAAGRAEVEVARGVLLRMDGDARVEVAELAPAVRIAGQSGAFRVRVAADLGSEVMLEAPGTSMVLKAGAEVRVDIAEDGYTRYTVLAGECEVAEPDRTRIPAKSRFYVEPGSLPSDAEPVAADSSDEFDAWSEERDGVRPSGNRCESCVRAGVTGAEKLDGYGEWVEVEGSSYWAPRVEASWRPYANGYWSSGPSGYVWISSDPFGYATHHYGSWSFQVGHGWLWAPARVWSGCHCYIGRHEDTMLWAPLDPFGRPVFLGHADVTLSGGIGVDFRAWSHMSVGGFVSGGHGIGLAHAGMFRGGFRFEHMAAPHLKLRSAMHGRTSLMALGGVKANVKVAGLHAKFRGIPAPGFHGKSKVHIKSPVMHAKFQVKGGHGGPKGGFHEVKVSGGGKGKVKVKGDGGKPGKIDAGGGKGKGKVEAGGGKGNKGSKGDSGGKGGKGKGKGGDGGGKGGDKGGKGGKGGGKGK